MVLQSYSYVDWVSVEAITAGSYAKDKASEYCSYISGHRSRSTLMKETRLDTNAKTTITCFNLLL